MKVPKVKIINAGLAYDFEMRINECIERFSDEFVLHQIQLITGHGQDYSALVILVPIPEKDNSPYPVQRRINS